ncbi:hypothetical protein ETAA8_42290 [Anatilimnocola aggregata]|uniref:Uncharacterized protein n=1 Tax=Anatilimnocola aggregata TaxID=2528021 RepID=A0A517YG11_9BACT|nr:hypothetical protein [Anatilimnocola aggregata]QDU29122.1 hypothetical protein ETAA8_42290 [Anatilimnocola aggregata]
MTRKSSKVTGSQSQEASKDTAMQNGAPPNQQDIKRRLGNFTTAGEHARQGGRTAGIVGQTKQKNHTDKKSS